VPLYAIVILGSSTVHRQSCKLQDVGGRAGPGRAGPGLKAEICRAVRYESSDYLFKSCASACCLDSQLPKVERVLVPSACITVIGNLRRPRVRKGLELLLVPSYYFVEHFIVLYARMNASQYFPVWYMSSSMSAMSGIVALIPFSMNHTG